MHAAAKREVKKRKAGGDDAGTPVGKQARRAGERAEGIEEGGGDEIEADLALPTLEEHFPHLSTSSASTPSELLTHLSRTTLHTNRAPLLLAFALTLLAYTMPEQPLSSRLSLAQAVVSEGARKRARELGIDPSGGEAEREGWGDGQPGVKVMGRIVKVMRRGVIADASNGPRGVSGAGDQNSAAVGDAAEGVVEVESRGEMQTEEKQEQVHALWALDLEALKKANILSSSSSSRSKGNATASLPIYPPQGARAYLMKSFASATAATVYSTPESIVPEEVDVDGGAESAEAVPPTRPKTAESIKSKSKAMKPPKPPSLAQQKAANLALLLTALDVVFASWEKVLGPDELDRRAWGWYVSVRPSVEEGAAGWGGKGEVDLGRVTGLRRVVKDEETVVKVKGEEATS